MASREEYFVLVHGHICGISCPGNEACASEEAFLTRVSEVEADPESLFDRQAEEGIRDAHVLRACAQALVEPSSLRQDCVGKNGMIRVVTRVKPEANAQSVGETMSIGTVPLGMAHRVATQHCP